MAGRLLVVLSSVLLPAVLAAQEFQPPSSGFSDRAAAFPHGSALDGLRIVVSPGHGWEGGTGGGFQRSLYKWAGCGACEGIVEDLLNAELCTDHLVPMLRLAGARVYDARQVDRQPAAVLADDGDAGYVERGPWQQGASPALGYGNDYRALHAPKGGHATWRLDVPAAGDYWVHARWAAGTNRCPDARFRVAHAGGAAAFTVDQRIDGSTWVALGRFRFEAGPATVVLEPPAAGDCHVIADAVRLGGGVDPASGRPWWQVSALQWLASQGAPGLADASDVTARPAHANALGADLFLSFHADAGGTTRTTGSSTYRYNCGIADTAYKPLDPAVCDRPAGSASLQYAIQGPVVADLRAEWDPGWVDRGRLVANFGELRVLEGIPGILFESAFFDGTETAAGLLRPDNRSLHDPRFRRTVARAIVRGVIAHAAPGATLPPEPPTHLAVRGNGGLLVATWRPVAGADGYRVHVATDGRGYDGGTVVGQPPATLGHVPAGRVALVRVTALNAGGESTASEAIAASAAPDGRPAAILVVNGFDRLDPWVREDRNRRDYALEHGIALAGAGHAFDGAADEALRDGDVPLAGYAMADWVLGRESAEHETFATDMQVLVAAWLDAGGCLVASGTEIAWDLGALGGPADQAFLAGRLGATYASDDAGTRTIAAPGDGAFAGLPAFAFGGADAVYDTPYPDVLAPVGTATAALRYASGDVAATALADAPGRAMLLGFPIEAIPDRDVRTALLDRLVAFCDAAGDPGGPDAGGPDAIDDAATASDLPPEAAGPDEAGVPPESGDLPANDADLPPADAPDAATWPEDAGNGADAPEGPDPDVPAGPPDDPADADAGVPTDRGDRIDAPPHADLPRDVATGDGPDAPGGARTGGGCAAGGRSPVATAWPWWVLPLLAWRVARVRRQRLRRNRRP